VLDIESNGLSPTIIWCCCVKNYKTGETRDFRDPEVFRRWLAEVKPILVGHNIISYDAYWLNLLWFAGIAISRCVDTLVLSYLYNPAIEGGHSLEAWGLRLGYRKTGHTDWSQFSEAMLEYCKNDVELTLRLFKALTDKMKQYKYSELSCEIEHKIRIIIDEQQRHGFWFDAKRAADFRGYLRNKQSDLSIQIQELFPPRRLKVAEYPIRTRKDGSPFASYERHIREYEVEINKENNTYACFRYTDFNIGSPIQRVERLLELGWKPEKFTEKGFPKVDEDALIKFADSAKLPAVTAMAEWLVIQGRASMLDTWLNNLGPDSRIHGRINTCGATTRRMTHSAPNTANIPSGAKAKYGHECRSFWGVQPGSGLKLVGYDAAGLETAGLCHYLNSQTATEILLRPKPDDVHTANARALTEALGREIDREWGAKTSWYAWLYGAGKEKLGTIVKGDIKDGEIIVDTFFRNVPGLKPLIESIKYEFKHNHGRLETIDGGFVICPSLSAALNYKIQSAGAIVMKLAAILLDARARKEGLIFHKVGDIHDEGQLEVLASEAQRLGSMAVDCITKAGQILNFRVPLTGDFKVGDSWDETH
jgi:DNA polymerase-1